ncbi:MAG: preprotein translocase subunit YajC [Dehalococcoidales bacterium]|jgi:preprotein translocase subunit YajC|nr:preprotein translocase subunit YajC [Dehalococcoidales bacterium]
MDYLPLIIIAVLFIGTSYLFGIRPMRQREKQHDKMVLDLEIGDTVLTAGGMYGKVSAIYEDAVIIEVESGAKIRMTKGGIVKREGEYLDAGQ